MIQNWWSLNVRTNHTVNIKISNVIFALISGVHLLGCGNNDITTTKYFQVEDTIFQGGYGCSSALVINTVTIVGSSFLCNAPGINAQPQQYDIFFAVLF